MWQRRVYDFFSLEDLAGREPRKVFSLRPLSEEEKNTTFVCRRFMTGMIKGSGGDW